MRRRWETALVVALALAWTVVIARLHVEGLSSPLDRFEEVCLDLRYQLVGRRPAPDDVVLIAIDDDTVRQAGAYPLPRPALASIVAAVARRKPKAIAIDLLLLSAGPPEADALLSQALRSAPAVIAAAALFDGEAKGAMPRGPLAFTPRPTRLLWPIEPMASAAEVGLVNIATGFGGTPRHVPLLFDGPQGIVPSFVLLTAALALDQTPRFAADGVSLGDRRTALDLGQHLVIRFYGPQGTIPTIGSQALDRPGAPSLAGRIVVIGTTAKGGGDTFTTPLATRLPGAEVLATAIDNLVRGDGLVRTRWTRWLDAAVALALTLSAVALIAARRNVLGLVLVIGLAWAWAALTVVAFGHGYWLSTSLPIAAMIPTAALHASVRLWQERRTAMGLARAERGLRPFNPRPVSDRLAADPAFLAQPLIRDAAVLFVDLAGYTTLSETTDPVRMRDLLKSFHALVDGTVDAHGGFVVTFMGDGAMILFGFPEHRPDAAAQALAALLRLGAQLAAWGSAEATGLERRVEARLAAHYGPVVISRLGGASHQQITATGDTVNVASRLLDVAKQHRVSTVISEEIVVAAGPAAPIERFAAAVAAPIRGRSRSVEVRLISEPGSAVPTG